MQIPNLIVVGCMICKRRQRIDLSQLDDGQLHCQKCDRLISIVDTSPMNSWIEQEVERKKRLQKSGELQTRIQTTDQNDQEIDRDGLHAEFASCAVLCPSRIADWQQSASSSQNNRGQDFPKQWTSLPKPTEIKYTHYFSNNRGYLLIRPPSGKGSNMKSEFVDDAIYFLLTNKGCHYKILGWVDREQFLNRKKIDPVGRKGNQVECWGVFRKNLTGLSKLPKTKRVNKV